MINTDKFKFWCQKVLPLTYDDSLSYYEVLCKCSNYINNLIENDKEMAETLQNMQWEIDDIEAFVNLENVIGQGESNLLFVTKTGGRFNTINDAIDYAKEYCSLSNRVTIAIVGGADIEYSEYIDLHDNPGIDLLGIGNPIVVSSVAWPLSTLYCNNDIVCDGITFRNYYTATGVDDTSGYGLHSDPCVGQQIYRHCTFLSANNSAVGLGMANNGSITFEDCKFISQLSSAYFHNNGVAGSQNQWLRFYDCNFETLGDHPCIIGYDVANALEEGRSSVMGLVFANCVAYPKKEVQFKYDDTHSVSYFPSNGRDATYIDGVHLGNIYLVQNSVCPGIPGLDFYHNVMRVYDTRVVATVGNFYYIPFPNANRYNFTIIDAAKSDGVGETWATVSDTSGITVYADNAYIDGIRVVWTGLNNGNCCMLNIKAVYKS